MLGKLCHRRQVGSGKTALVTLLHEGGHAAHFANIEQATPLASQERAPTSVAYAENQSMFLDSLAGAPRHAALAGMQSPVLIRVFHIALGACVHTNCACYASAGMQCCAWWPGELQ